MIARFWSWLTGRRDPADVHWQYDPADFQSRQTQQVARFWQYRLRQEVEAANQALEALRHAIEERRRDD